MNRIRCSEIALIFQESMPRRTQQGLCQPRVPDSPACSHGSISVRSAARARPHPHHYLPRASAATLAVSDPEKFCRPVTRLPRSIAAMAGSHACVQPGLDSTARIRIERRHESPGRCFKLLHGRNSTCCPCSSPKPPTTRRVSRMTIANTRSLGAAWISRPYSEFFTAKRNRDAPERD